MANVRHLMHYLAALIVPVLILIRFRAKITSARAGLRFALRSALGMYVLSVALAFMTSEVLSWHLESFDLNHDGAFSANEQTPEQMAAMDAVVDDTGRNLSPIFSAPWSLLVSLGIFLPLGWFNAKSTRHNPNA